MTTALSEAEFREKYLERAKAMTPDGLEQFKADVMAEEWDYGTTCVAFGLIAGATAWALERGPKGGVTGFMAGAISWEFLRTWGSLFPGETGGRMQNFDDLLYPLSGEKFTSITPDTFKLVQKKAAKLLKGKNEYAAPRVIAHWQSIVDGTVPFGLELRNS